MSILEHDERDQTQHRSKHCKNQASILTAHVVEEGAREKRCHGTKRVSHQTLASNSRGRRLAIAVGSVRVCTLEDKVDTEGDRGEADHGTNPDEVFVLRKGVDEKADGQPDGAEHCAVETVLGNNTDVGVCL